MRNFKLEAPWNTYWKMLKALFEKDKDIIVGDIRGNQGSDVNYVIDIEVKNHEKFIALDRAMSHKKTFGNVVVGINLYDEENSTVGSLAELYQTIFDGNEIVKDIPIALDITGTEHAYVEFIPEVVQFPDDDISDYNGNWNGLAEDIAREVFDDSAINPFLHFCTASKEE